MIEMATEGTEVVETEGTQTVQTANEGTKDD